MTFTVTALVLLAWEAAAIASGRVPTITEVMRPRPAWQPVLFVLSSAAIALDHLVWQKLP